MKSTDTLLELTGVSVSFDGFKAINNLSFDIGAAELRAIIGPNGAGKTTMMDIITGKTRADSGHVLWGDLSKDLTKMSESEMALRNNRNPFQVLFYAMSGGDRSRVDELAQEVGLLKHLDRLAGELSHGQKQWLEIGMLLAQEPLLLLVDEPAAGMTPEEREHTTTILKRAAETRAVVVVEHDMEFVRRLDCRVTVLHEGSVLSEGSIDHVIQDKKVIEVYLGR
jgi:urea transport system ATP-binding protein